MFRVPAVSLCHSCDGHRLLLHPFSIEYSEACIYCKQTTLTLLRHHTHVMPDTASLFIPLQHSRQDHLEGITNGIRYHYFSHYFGWFLHWQQFYLGKVGQGAKLAG